MFQRRRSCPGVELLEQSNDVARQAMEQRVAHHAGGGPDQIDSRLKDLNDEPDSRLALEAEERFALKALRGDFGAVFPLTTAQERADVATFEGEGGQGPRLNEEDASDRRDRSAVASALRAARL